MTASVSITSLGTLSFGGLIAPPVRNPGEYDEYGMLIRTCKCGVKLLSHSHSICGPCLDRKKLSISVFDHAKEARRIEAINIARWRKNDPKAYYDSLPDL